MSDKAMPRPRPLTWGLALLGIVLVAGTTAIIVIRPSQAARVATGFISQTLCSAAFVARVDPDQVYDETVRQTPGLGLIEKVFGYRVDRTRREVVATALGAFESRAIFRQGVGCMLVHGQGPLSRLAAPVDDR